jgi:hypothetical protein
MMTARSAFVASSVSSAAPQRSDQSAVIGVIALRPVEREARGSSG